MMAASSIPVVESSLSTPKVRLVSLDHPWQWLAAGWKDLWQTPAASISYGLLFVIMGYLLVYLVEARPEAGADLHPGQPVPVRIR